MRMIPKIPSQKFQRTKCFFGISAALRKHYAGFQMLASRHENPKPNRRTFGISPVHPRTFILLLIAICFLLNVISGLRLIITLKISTVKTNLHQCFPCPMSPRLLAQTRHFVLWFVSFRSRLKMGPLNPTPKMCVCLSVCRDPHRTGVQTLSSPGACLTPGSEQFLSRDNDTYSTFRCASRDRSTKKSMYSFYHTTVTD